MPEPEECSTSTATLGEVSTKRASQTKSSWPVSHQKLLMGTPKVRGLVPEKPGTGRWLVAKYDAGTEPHPKGVRAADQESASRPRRRRVTSPPAESSETRWNSQGFLEP